MDSRASRQLAGVGLACLIVILQPQAFSAGLRDEAVKYRTEGYERQQRGDLVGAVEAYQKAVALDAAYPTPYNDLGVIYEQRGEFERAQQAYEQALLLDPKYLQAHTNLAMLQERMGHKDEAIVHWLKRYQLGDPHDPWTVRAEERLIALGVLKTHPGLKGKLFTRRRVVEQELAAHEQSIDDFHAVSERWR